MSRNAGSGENGHFGEICVVKVADEITRANKLTQLEGPRNVGEFGENGEFGECGERLLAKW